MRIKDDLRRCVVFLGVETIDQDSGQQKTECVGTGFFLAHEGFVYLVTAKHVAEGLSASPFVMRGNTKAGPAGNIEFEKPHWHFHDDDLVDVAVLAGGPNQDHFDYVTLGQDFPLTTDRVVEEEIGAGDRVHIIGLFRLMSGTERILPVVHAGIIALFPEDARIPVQDANTGRLKEVEGYLVEAQALSGLSGSPVFVDRTWRIKVAENQVIKGDANTYLLGLWMASWDAPPGAILAAGRKEPVRVPVGMGIVAPAQKIVDVLETTELADLRRQAREESSLERAATLDSALPTKADNPDHREDFNSLLGAAVPGNKSDR